MCFIVFSTIGNVFLPLHSFLIGCEIPRAMRFSLLNPFSGKLETGSDIMVNYFLTLVVFPCRCSFNQNPRQHQGEILNKASIYFTVNYNLSNGDYFLFPASPREYLAMARAIFGCYILRGATVTE